MNWALGQARITVSQVAELIHLSGRTLYHWLRRKRGDDLVIRARGRSPEQGTVQERNDVVAFVREQGPHVGLPTLQARFPERPRRELEDLLQRYRRAYTRRKRFYAEVLSWKEPGTVWAMDFTKPESLPIDGEYPRVFVVRDLASGKVLESLPVRAEDAITCRGALIALFVRYGAPLVLKADNGSAFIADLSRDLLASWDVALLYSPPQTPSYNGSCEAGMGGLKTRAHYHAARHGRAGAWTCDDVEAGRRQGNELGRPHGPNGPTAMQSWNARAEISAREREAFLASWKAHQGDARVEREYEPGQVLTRAEQAEIDRQAIRRALVEHGLLCVERGWIPLRKKR